ncbi:hypothetical protein LCGC14_2609430 [marine sediment metagenome]|uniref:Uncharacterized protein n=1 Tax=marine sediment metagenome TaxID=412755 RepID=A0A0F9A6K0_9ZZZZ
MSRLTIKWVDKKTLKSPQCEFCKEPFPTNGRGRVPQLELDIIAKGARPEEPTYLGGAFPLCRACQRAMQIQPRDTLVDMWWVRKVFHEKCDAITEEEYPEYVGLLTSEVYGSG